MTVAPGNTNGTGATLLEVEDLKKHFVIRKGVFSRVHGQVHAVDGVTFSIKHGETLGLVGESGCGKSTVGRTLLKLLEPTAGTIRVRGTDITGLDPTQMMPYRRQMQMIHQDPYASLNPFRTITQILSAPLFRHHLVRNRRHARERIYQLLELVDLTPVEDFCDKYPHQLSGGQRQSFRSSSSRSRSRPPGR